MSFVIFVVVHNQLFGLFIDSFEFLHCIYIYIYIYIYINHVLYMHCIISSFGVKR